MTESTEEDSSESSDETLAEKFNCFSTELVKLLDDEDDASTDFNDQASVSPFSFDLPKTGETDFVSDEALC